MDVTLIEKVFARRAARREERREFLKAAAVTGAVAAGSAFLASCGGDDGGKVSTPPTTQINDADILNFALNLEYLEANFYSYAVNGTGIAAGLQGGTGTQGAIIGGQQVNFSGDPVTGGYAREIATDEANHVAFLRGALGTAAVAQPAIDRGGTDPNGDFSPAARAAGLVGAGQVFNPYASPENFLLGAFIFEDVGVTAYKGAAPLVSNKTYLQAASSILAVEAYHAGLVRSVLYAKGIAMPQQTLISATNAISNARNQLNGSANNDQGITVNGQANIVPADSNAIAYGRTTGQVLDIVYLTKLAATKGGFFPNGVNGTINQSTAS